MEKINPSDTKDIERLAKSVGDFDWHSKLEKFRLEIAQDNYEKDFQRVFFASPLSQAETHLVAKGFALVSICGLFSLASVAMGYWTGAYAATAFTFAVILLEFETVWTLAKKCLWEEKISWDEYSNYLLTPRDTLEFLKTTVEDFLRNNENKVSVAVNLFTKQKQELDWLEEKDRQFFLSSEGLNLSGDRDAVKHNLEQAKYIKEGLKKLRTKFKSQAQELEKVIQQRDDLENLDRVQKECEEIRERVLDNITTSSLMWEDFLSSLNNDLNTMKGFSQDQLTYCKDQTEGEIELLYSRQLETKQALENKGEMENG